MMTCAHIRVLSNLAAGLAPYDGLAPGQTTITVRNDQGMRIATLDVLDELADDGLITVRGKLPEYRNGKWSLAQVSITQKGRAALLEVCG